jgi:hypothetical protein
LNGELPLILKARDRAGVTAAYIFRTDMKYRFSIVITIQHIQMARPDRFINSIYLW